MERRKKGRGSRRLLGLAAGIGIALLVARPPAAVAAGTHDVPLPSMPTLEDLAWTPLAGSRLLLTTNGDPHLTVLDAAGQPTGKMYFPLPHIRDMKAMADGTLVLGDRRTGRIYHVKADGPLLGSAGARGLSAGQFLQLDRVDADSQGRLYGMDGAELKVLQFSPKGELLGSFSVETGPVVDSKDRLLEVLDQPSSGSRRIVAFTAPNKTQTVLETKLDIDTRWEPMAALADGSILIRGFDAGGGVFLQRLDPGGKKGAKISLPEDAVLAGPVRVLAVAPDEHDLYYLAGISGHYRFVRVELAQ